MVIRNYIVFIIACYPRANDLTQSENSTLIVASRAANFMICWS